MLLNNQSDLENGCITAIGGSYFYDEPNKLQYHKYVSDVKCLGTESEIQQCANSGWGVKMG